MDKEYLIRIIKSNQNLLEDLKKSQYIQNEFLGMVRSIESMIPEDSRENFYKNLKTLRINIIDTQDMKENAAGVYKKKSNEICINKNMILKLQSKNIGQNYEGLSDIISTTIYHELLHMASTTRDEKTNYYASGFQNIKRDERGKLIYAEEYEGMTEGFIELLTCLAFVKKTKGEFSEYGIQANLLEHLAILTDLETIKKSLFNNKNGMSLVDEKLKDIDGVDSHDELYQKIEYDYKLGVSREERDNYERKLLASIEQELICLSSKKANKLLRENPSFTQKLLNNWWKDVEDTINFSEKLESMGEKPERYEGINKMRQQFMKARRETIENTKIQISKDNVETATKDTRISDINSQVRAIKEQIQVNEKDERGGL